MSVQVFENWFLSRIGSSCEVELRAVVRRINRRHEIQRKHATEVEEIQRQNGWPSGETLVAELETTVMHGG